MSVEPKVPETALAIENQAAVCFSPPHCRSLELDFGFEFQQEELSNGFRLDKNTMRAGRRCSVPGLKKKLTLSE
jgi:hypothetical protein